MRQRRRAERGRVGSRVAEGRNRRLSEQKQQRFLIWGAAAVAVLLVAFLTVGWTVTNFMPSRQVVAVVEGETIRARDIVPFTQMDAVVSGFLRPDASLDNYIRGMVLRKRIGTRGETVTADQVTGRIAQFFDPDYDAENPPTTLSAEARRRFDRHLSAINVGERDFRIWVENQLLDETAFNHFVRTETPDEAPQVFVRWILAETPELAIEALTRVVNGEDFAAVANELNRETSLADENGEVGWVPEGAFPELDKYLFGEAAAHGELLVPQEEGFDRLVLFVEDSPSTQPVSETMKELLAEPLFIQWLEDRWDELVDRRSITNANIRWIIEQLT